MAGSDDRIDVVVTDGIDPNVDLKLRQIAASADKGQASVLRLKAELASMNLSGVQKLKAEMDASTATLNKQLVAQTGLTKATDASAAADIKAVSSKAKLVAEIDAEAAAQARLALVIDKTIARQEAANAATAARYASGANPFQGAANPVGAGSLGLEAAAVGSSAKQVEAEVAAAEVATVGSFGRIKLAGLAAYDGIRDAAYTFAGNFKGFFGAAGASTVEGEAVAVGKLGAAAKVNSTALREFFVIPREIARGNWSRIPGSVSILAQSLGILRSVLLPLVAVLAVAAASFELFKVSIQGDADKQLQEYSTHLGLTSKEMRKLGDETVSAQGKLKKFNDIKLTFGDVFHGLTKTIEQTFDLSPALTKAKNVVYDALVEIVKAFFEAGAELSGVFASVYYGIQAVWKNLAALIGDIMVQAVNKTIETVEDMVNDVIGGIDKLAKGANELLGTNLFGTIANVQLPRMQNQFAGTAKYVGKVFTDAYKQGHDGAIKFDNDFLANWKKNSIEAGKQRLKEMAGAIQNNRNPHKEADPKTKADYLNDANKKLDDELSRMHLLKDAREEQQRLDEIEEQFAKRRQPLTAAEIQGFKDKIHAIQEYKYEQQEMDRIYDQFNGAQKTFTAAIAASNGLLKDGKISASEYALAVAQAKQALDASKDPTGVSAAKDARAVALAGITVALDNFSISQKQATEQTNLANRAYQEATDKLFPLKQAIAADTVAVGLYGDAVQKNAYYQQIRNSEFGKANNLSAQYVAGVNAEVDALMKQNDALRQQQTIQSQVGGIVNPIIEQNTMLQNKALYYAELDRMSQKYNLSEAQRAQARYALDLKFNEMRLQGASQFFGQLAQLSSSKNKKLAAIGKAAAVAQATIDGYLAVQKALATIPPPFNIAVAAATAVMAGVQVAGILSTNVGNFKDGGDFLVQGNAGVDRNNIAMNVSRGERITIQTPEQQRQASRGGSPTNVTVPIKVINVRDKHEITEHMQSEEGVRVILNVLKDNPSHVAAAASAAS